MKWISLLFGLGLLGFAVNKYYLVPQTKAKTVFAPDDPPPPPPPVESPPPPVIDAKTLEKIRVSTKDTTPAVRWEAIQLLIKSGVPEADDFLFDMLQRDTEAELRKRAVDALKSRPGPKVSKVLLHALHDSEADVRQAALGALGAREETPDDPAASPAISELLRDSDERVRLDAIRTLNLLNDKRTQKAREAAERNQRAQQDYQQKVKDYQEAQEKAAKKKR